MMHDDGEKNFRQIPGSGHTDIICSDFEGLTQVSRRVRSEFLPLFMSHLGVKVSMLDLEEFMQKVIVPALGRFDRSFTTQYHYSNRRRRRAYE